MREKEPTEIIGRSLSGGRRKQTTGVLQTLSGEKVGKKPELHVAASKGQRPRKKSVRTPIKTSKRKARRWNCAKTYEREKETVIRPFLEEN